MIYSFGDYELDRQRYELGGAGRLVKIEPQVCNRRHGHGVTTVPGSLRMYRRSA
jgi:hypothetical protein